MVVLMNSKMVGEGALSRILTNTILTKVRLS